MAGKAKIQWKGVSSLAEAQRVIDGSVLLAWANMPGLKRAFTADDQVLLIGLMIANLRKKPQEQKHVTSSIAVENILIYLASVGSEFLDEVLVNELAHNHHAAREFLSCCQSLDYTEPAHSEELEILSLLLIAKLGLALHHQLPPRDHPAAPRHPSLSEGPPKSACDTERAKLLAAIDSHLLSMSNKANLAIRLALVEYFGFLAGAQDEAASHFIRLSERYGYSVAEQLFVLLDHKEHGPVARHYLLAFCQHLLRIGGSSQEILHFIFRGFMLRQPEGFLLFFESFREHIVAHCPLGSAERVILMQHMAKLLENIAETENRLLTSSLLYFLATNFREKDYQELLLQLQGKAKLAGRRIHLGLKDIAAVTSLQQLLKLEAALRIKKRGRKPRLKGEEYTGPLSRIASLQS